MQRSARPLPRAWKLPALLVAPIRYHENPASAEEELLPLVRSVALGNRVADIFLSEEGDGDALGAYYTQAAVWFNIPRDGAEPLLKESPSTDRRHGPGCATCPPATWEILDEIPTDRPTKRCCRSRCNRSRRTGS